MKLRQLVIAATGSVLIAAAPSGLNAQPMHGEYSLGEGGDFATFNAAVAALVELGIDGPVIFNVEPGTYLEKVTVPEIEGTSESNTVTFAGTDGAPDDVVLTCDVYDGYTHYNSDYEKTTGTLNIDGADFITFRNITVSTQENGPINVIVLRNGADNFTLDGAVLSSPFSIKGDIWGEEYYLLNSINTKALNNNLSLVNTTFDGGNRQIRYIVTSSLGFVDGFEVDGCTFTGDPVESVNIVYTNNVRIVNNSFASGHDYYDESGYNFYPYDCVSTYRIGGNVEITGNRVTAHVKARESSDAQRAVFLKLSTVNEATKALIANNVAHIANQGCSETYFLIFNSAVHGDIKVLHNTAVIDNPNLNWNATSSNSAVVRFNVAPANSALFANNSFQNVGKGVIYYGYDKAGTNIAYSNNHYNSIANFATTNGSLENGIDFDTWLGLSGETGHVLANVDMDANLRPDADALRQLFGKGQSFASIVGSDIEGTTRPELPTIGAFEAPGQVGVTATDVFGATVRYAARTLEIFGFDGDTIRIVDLSGKTVDTFRVNSDVYRRNISLNAGLYIIYAKNLTAKMAVR